MPIAETIIAALTALLGVIVASVPTVLAVLWNSVVGLINGLFDLMNRLGFIAYWTVVVALLFLDIPTNLVGTLVSIFSQLVLGVSVSTVVVFALVLFSGLVYLLWKSKEGLTYTGRQRSSFY